MQFDPVPCGLDSRAGCCAGFGVMQFDPHALRLATPHCERGVADAHDERIPPGTRLGEDLDLLAVHEAELEQSTLEG
jgi:hypothetical protein